MLMGNPHTEQEVIKLLKRLSGRSEIESEYYIGKDIGVFGSDSIVLFEGLEDRFGLALEPLME